MVFESLARGIRSGDLWRRAGGAERGRLWRLPGIEGRGAWSAGDRRGTGGDALLSICRAGLRRDPRRFPEEDLVGVSGGSDRATANIEVLARTEVTALHGNGSLEAITLRNGQTGDTRRAETRNLFLCL